MCIPAFHDWQCAEVPNEFSLVYLFFSTDLFYWGCFSSWHAGGGGGAVVVVLVAVGGGGGGGVVAGTRSQKQCEWPPLSSTHLSLPLATHLERRQTQGQTWGHKGIVESIQTQKWTTFLEGNHIGTFFKATHPFNNKLKRDKKSFIFACEGPNELYLSIDISKHLQFMMKSKNN